jgi:5-methylcytosine-specific restriction endonuclease McrA
MDSKKLHGRNKTEQEKQDGGNQSQTKTCSKCGETKGVGEFHKNRTCKFGVDSRCKVCISAIYAANKERRSAYNAAYYADNKAHINAATAAYYAKNKERMYVANTAWKKANRDKTKAIATRRRARKANAKGDFTADQWKDRLAYHGYKCVYCGVEKHETPEGWLSCDHMIPLSKGGTNWPSNLVPACRSCNCSKGTKTYFEYMESKK